MHREKHIPKLATQQAGISKVVIVLSWPPRDVLGQKWKGPKKLLKLGQNPGTDLEQNHRETGTEADYSFANTYLSMKLPHKRVPPNF